MSFASQDKFVKDTSRYIVAQCSRRAGKTNGLALRFFRTLSKHPKSFCLYIALTRESARNILWPILQEMNEKFLLDCTFTESNLTMTHPNGARLQLFGADMKNFIRRLKGIKTPGAAIDEAQDFGSHLQSLVDDVIGPTLTDYEDSWLAITGTPGPIPLGYFYSISHQKKYGFSFHSWTLFENPYLPHAEDFICDLKQKRGWDNENPTLKREWYNQWILDLESLWVKYDVKNNHYDVLPRGVYSYILGVDIGFRDSDALCVLAWNEDSPVIYLVEEEITAEQDITTLTHSIEKLIQKYNPSKIIMDEGGLGKKVAEELRRRRHIPISPADKARKMENVAFLNDWLRLGKFKAKSTSRFVEDSYKVQIDWEKSRPDKIVLKDSFHSDIIDAVLYAFKESPAYTYQKPKPTYAYGSKEWAKEQEELMEQATIERLERESNANDLHYYE